MLSNKEQKNLKDFEERFGKTDLGLDSDFVDSAADLFESSDEESSDSDDSSSGNEGEGDEDEDHSEEEREGFENVNTRSPGGIKRIKNESNSSESGSSSL